MTKSEREQLTSICNDIEDSDDKIDALERLYSAVKQLLKGVSERQKQAFVP